jgi:MFS family permease
MQPTHRSFKSVLMYLLAALFLCYEMAVQVSPSVMTADLMRDFKVDAAMLGIISGAYFISYSLMQIPVGLLFDRYPSRVLLTLATLLCAVGILFFSKADSVYLAAVGRLLMGLGSAFAFVGVLVVATHWFAPKYFAFLVGVAQLLAALGAINGEWPLAHLLMHFGWRQTALILAIIGLVLGFWIFLLVRDPKSIENQQRQCVAASISGVMSSLSSVMARGQTWWVALYAFAAWAPMTAFAELWGVPYLKAVHGLSDVGAARAIALLWLGVGLTSPVLGAASDRLGRRGLLLSATALLGFIASAVVIYMPQTPLWLTYFLLFAFGMGVAGQILSFAVVRDINTPQVVATAIGLNNMAVVIGGVLFQPLTGILMHHHAGQVIKVAGIPQYSVADYQYGLLVVPLCFLVGLVVSQFFIEESYQSQPD